MKKIIIALVFGIGIGVVVGRWSKTEERFTPLSGAARVEKDPTAARRLGSDTVVAARSVEEPRISSAPTPESSADNPTAHAPVAKTRPTASRGTSGTISKARLEMLDDSTDMARLLDDARSPNLFETIRNATAFQRMDENLSPLNGRFAGIVRFPQDPNKQWEMTTEVNLRFDARKLQGDVRIVLAENGKAFSTLSGSNDQSDQFTNPGDGPAILVRAAPDGVFQLFYVPKLDIFIGNYYKQTKPDQYQPKGTVRLDRA